jgi:hypothetical protein
MVDAKVLIKNNWKTLVFKPNWLLGKKAGPIRNEKMITEGKPDYAICFLQYRN